MKPSVILKESNVQPILEREMRAGSGNEYDMAILINTGFVSVQNDAGQLIEMHIEV